MAHPTGESNDRVLKLDFGRRVMLQFRGSVVTSDAGLLAFRELDDALRLTKVAIERADVQTGKNGRHALIDLLRQSVFGRVAGYEDVNDADRLVRDPAMRWIAGGRAATKQAASTSQMGRFETEWLANDQNLVALADLGGRWADRVHSRRSLNSIVLDMHSSVSETYGDQEGTAYNRHFACTCYYPLFVFNQFGDLERCVLRSGNVDRPRVERRCWNRSWPGIGYRASSSAVSFAPCRLRGPGGLRVTGGRRLQVRDPVACQQRLRENPDGHVFKGDRWEECVQMPAKMIRPSTTVRAASKSAVVRAALLAKHQVLVKISASLGVIRGILVWIVYFSGWSLLLVFCKDASDSAVAERVTWRHDTIIGK